jgi:hypothetical protein
LSADAAIGFTHQNSPRIDSGLLSPLLGTAGEHWHPLSRRLHGHAAIPPSITMNSQTELAQGVGDHANWRDPPLPARRRPAVYEFERAQDLSKADASAFLFGRKNCHLKLSERSAFWQVANRINGRHNDGQRGRRSGSH